MKLKKSTVVRRSRSLDEKTGIQALNRTQPGLPLRARKPGAWTNEYVRHSKPACLLKGTRITSELPTMGGETFRDL
jgi:hypothetical protein